MARIFVNYRCGDVESAAALIDAELARVFGREQVFRAGRSIGPGEIFDKEIFAAIRSADVLLALIGPNWLTVTDGRGNRKLDNPRDFVRREISEAIRHGVRVVPVLLGAARITEDQLPSDIAALASYQDISIRAREIHHDLPRLLDSIRKVVPGLPGEQNLAGPAGRGQADRSDSTGRGSDRFTGSTTDMNAGTGTGSVGGHFDNSTVINGGVRLHHGDFNIGR